MHVGRLRPYIVLVPLLLALGVVGTWFWQHRAHAPESAPQAKTPAVVAQQQVQPVVPVGMESHVLFGGDVFWGRGLHKRAQASPLKEAYPFSRLHEFGRGDYDAWIANLECPTVPGVEQPYALEQDKLLFNCSSAYLPEAAKWFTAVSLANNHTANQNGQAGLDATRTALEAQKIQYFGHYNPNKLDDICEVVSLPARLRLSDATEQAARLPVALCGYHGVAVTPSAEAVAVMQRYAKVMPVIAYSHMGAEYKATPDNARRVLYQAMIDSGADAVMGAHPHWVQPVEMYKGKPIAYSLGNFMFDQEPGETRRGAAISLVLGMKDATVPAETLRAWATLGDTCAAFRDTCLAQAEQQQLPRLPFTFSYDAKGVDMTGVTHPADEATSKQILERLTWPTIALQLQDSGVR